MVTLTPSWANSTGGSPYSFSKAHLAPLLSANHHSASRTLTTNQPWVTGVSPDPKSSSSAPRTDAILAAHVSERLLAAMTIGGSASLYDGMRFLLTSSAI